MRSKWNEQNSSSYFQERPTVVSDAFGVTGTLTNAGVATTAILGQVSIPKGAYVTKVQLMATVAVGTQDIDVGDGDDTARYMEGIVSMTQYDLWTAPNAIEATVAAGQVAGRYYASADTIDVTSDVAASADVSVGSCILSVWYYV